MMSLSEREQRTLDQIAEQLKLQDPKLASKMGSGAIQTVPGRLVATVALVIVVGCLVLLAGIATRALFLGVAGFAIMGVGAYLASLRIRVPAVRPARGRHPAPGETGHG
ncbi:DUF3040 domain-containing protein [Pseudarthrobacter raffinosi]|uniref:DUF3040 domain-containing protein n=1 Tax=Pseudarthrobacter raffinosi TaxID=2953651 RepID=UPI00208ECE1E|nr:MULTISPECIES: DUF3040 domain-containing protein [unclassified Pseudarthrobacter]MCO4239694.1 DUF3040 domain-containing protein [Pseudarthrobacter sp. MDT3-28]MCO4265273.1 DUF3040 domain-containing protein [Pseudarthrobacter sp. MDT3-26]